MARLGNDLAAILAPGDVVALSGDLGMGKSVLARSIVRALAADPGLEVPSPTFTLVQPYRTPRFPVLHADLYRLKEAADLRELGLDDPSGVVLVEWPERVPEALPDDALVVAIRPGRQGNGRAVTLAGAAARWSARLDRTLRIRALLGEAGCGEAVRAHLQGDASARRYERAEAEGRSVVVMDWPPPTSAPPLLRDRLSYAELAHIQTRAPAFAAVAAALRAEGFCAPDLFAADLADGLLVLEDLGRATLVEDGRPVPERYEAAADLLADLAAVSWPAEVPVPGGGAHRVPPYDLRALVTEVRLFGEWYMPHVLGRALEPAAEEEHAALWTAALARLATAETTWTLRDFHSPNVIWRPDRAGRDRLGLIDFQDAVVGPAAYDVAALATDARVDLPADLQAAIVDRYAAARRARHPAFDRTAFDEAFVLCAAQRNAKILGGFARSARRDGKTAYLAHLPRVRRALRQALAHEVLSPLRLWYERRNVLE